MMAGKIDFEAIKLLDKLERGLTPEKVDLLYHAALELYIAGVEAGYCSRTPADEKAIKGVRREVYKHLQRKTKQKVHIPLYIE
jgi:hypothetical protein